MTEGQKQDFIFVVTRGVTQLLVRIADAISGLHRKIIQDGLEDLRARRKNIWSDLSILDAKELQFRHKVTSFDRHIKLVAFRPPLLARISELQLFHDGRTSNSLFENVEELSFFYNIFDHSIDSAANFSVYYGNRENKPRSRTLQFIAA